MILLIVLFTITLVSILLLSKYGEFSTVSPFAITALITGAFGLTIAGISIPMNRYSTYAGIEKLNALQKTVTRARENEVDLEKAAIQTPIIEINMWLKEEQYWNKTIFDIWYPDEIDTINPVQ